jgi:hypothetical protein
MTAWGRRADVGGGYTPSARPMVVFHDSIHLRLEEPPCVGALGSNDVVDRYPGGRRGIDESLGAARDDALDEPAGEIRQSGGRPVDVSPSPPADAAAYTATPFNFAAFFDGSCATHPGPPRGPHNFSALAPPPESVNDTCWASSGSDTEGKPL